MLWVEDLELFLWHHIIGSEKFSLLSIIQPAVDNPR